jgi:NAD(P)-dependent dehydrogenase (short-subunit alcohol dehydrogenase family)
MSDLAGKVAVVTGGGKGIGLAISQALAKSGASLVIMGRDIEALDEAKSSMPGSMAVHVDVSEGESVRKAFAKIEQVDILVNNAGAAESAPFGKTTEALWQRMMAVNLTGSYHCAQAVLQGMRTRRSGRIVNIASTAALNGYPYVTAYCAAKHGLLGLTRALALEVAKEGITVNAVCPGYTVTGMLLQSVANIVSATGKSEDSVRDLLARSNPQHRFVTPEEVAACVLWLCSPAAEGVTGQAIPIDGGESIR